MVWHGQPPSVNCPEDVCSKGHDRICVGFPANRLRCKMKNNVRGNLANDALEGKAALISTIRESRRTARLRQSNKLGWVEGANASPVILAPSWLSHALSHPLETCMASYKDAASTISLQ